MTARFTNEWCHRHWATTDFIIVRVIRLLLVLIVKVIYLLDHQLNDIEHWKLENYLYCHHSSNHILLYNFWSLMSSYFAYTDWRSNKKFYFVWEISKSSIWDQIRHFLARISWELSQKKKKNPNSTSMLLDATRRYSEFSKNHDLKLIVFRERRWENRLIHVLCESVASRRWQEHEEDAY
jgi:hypothetical protein